MLRLVILSAVLCCTFAHDSFSAKYAYTKVMTNCVGEKAYYDWSKEVLEAAKACYGEGINLPEKDASDESSEEDESERLGGKPVFLQLFYSPKEGSEEGDSGFPFRAFMQRQKREAVMYDAPLLKGMLHKVISKTSNFTCVLRKLRMIDDNFNIDYDSMIQTWREVPVDQSLQESMVKSVQFCKKFTEAVPLEDTGSPMPRKLQEILVFTKCERKARMKVCMKYDLKKHFDKFDLSELPLEGDETEDEKVEKVLHLLWAFENKNDLQVY